MAGTDEVSETVDLAKSCHALLERLDFGDGKKLFHEVEGDIEKAGGLVYDAFTGRDDEGLKETILRFLARDEE